MQTFANDFSAFTTMIFTTIRNFFTQFFSTVLGEIFLFVIIAGIFVVIISWIISLGKQQ